MSPTPQQTCDSVNNTFDTIYQTFQRSSPPNITTACNTITSIYKQVIANEPKTGACLRNPSYYPGCSRI
jgi:hypothetical protein